MMAWDATAAAVEAAAAAERRAEESVEEDWAAVADKVDAAIAVSHIDNFSILDPVGDCPKWISAWGVWKEWAAAMPAANNVLAALS